MFAGIHIESSGDITVQGASINDLTTDAFLALPTHVLSVDYYIISYRYMNVSKHRQGPTQFAVVGVHENTKVLVTFPREGLRLKLKVTNGRTLSFKIGRFETKQVLKCGARIRGAHQLHVVNYRPNPLLNVGPNTNNYRHTSVTPAILR